MIRIQITKYFLSFWRWKLESLQFSSRSLPSCKTKQNKIETKQTRLKQNETIWKKIKPKQNVCACAVAKLLLKVTVFCKTPAINRTWSRDKLHENLRWNRSWFTRAILKLQLQRDKNCIELRDKNRLCKRALRSGAFINLFLFVSCALILASFMFTHILSHSGKISVCLETWQIHLKC